MPPGEFTRARANAAATLAVLALTVAATPAGAVVGGVTIDPASVPYIARLGPCTGTLIAPDRVLTAAHCTDDLHVGQRIVFGGHVARRLARVARDYDYPHNITDAAEADDPHPFDAAILDLDAPVTAIAPVRLATAADVASYPPGTPATTLGFGVDDAHGQAGSGVLRSGAVEIHSDRACQSLLEVLDSAEEFIAPDMLCTTDPDRRAPFVSGCFGDSGGPLVVTTPGTPPLQVGIDNWGVYCGAHHGDPENYADVAVVSAFAMTASPQWTPLALDRPQLRGTFATGHTVFCTAPTYADPQPTKLVYIFDDNGFSAATASTRRRFVIPVAMRHERLTCTVQAQTRGGRSLSDHSPAAFVAGGDTELHG